MGAVWQNSDVKTIPGLGGGFNIEKISNTWKTLLEELKSKYPTDESRKVPAKMFVYRTS